MVSKLCDRLVVEEHSDHTCMVNRFDNSRRLELCCRVIDTRSMVILVVVGLGDVDAGVDDVLDIRCTFR
jgi:hypothetical protein